MNRTRYKKSLIRPDKPDASGLWYLRPASYNGKLSKITRDTVKGGIFKKPARTSKIIQKGRWKGLSLYYLTLEERNTCPVSCNMYGMCYGNNMPFAKRWDHADPEFYHHLHADLTLLNLRHKKGFVVRLHELGDFFSEDYIWWWKTAMRYYPALHVFGYTHRHERSFSKAIDNWQEGCSDRVAIMNSDGNHSSFRPDAYVDRPDLAVTCPEQTGKTLSCITCGLCMNGHTDINFINHSRGQR